MKKFKIEGSIPALEVRMAIHFMKDGTLKNEFLDVLNKGGDFFSYYRDVVNASFNLRITRKEAKGLFYCSTMMVNPSSMVKEVMGNQTEAYKSWFVALFDAPTVYAAERKKIVGLKKEIWNTVGAAFNKGGALYELSLSFTDVTLVFATTSVDEKRQKNSIKNMVNRLRDYYKACMKEVGLPEFPIEIKVSEI